MSGATDVPVWALWLGAGLFGVLLFLAALAYALNRRASAPPTGAAEAAEDVKRGG